MLDADPSEDQTRRDERRSAHAHVPLTHAHRHTCEIEADITHHVMPLPAPTHSCCFESGLAPRPPPPPQHC